LGNWILLPGISVLRNMSIIKKPGILMVCLGNICRSPLAEGIFSSMAKAMGFDCRVDSAGTGNWHIGEPPHPLSCRIASMNNIDISHLRARQFAPVDFDDFDLIYFMDRENLKDAKKIAGPKWNPSKAALLLDVLKDDDVKDVPDPYFGGFDGYIEVFELITGACEKIIVELNMGNKNATI
jgi:protein-tyrosine phosphatase